MKIAVFRPTDDISVMEVQQIWHVIILRMGIMMAYVLNIAENIVKGGFSQQMHVHYKNYTKQLGKLSPRVPDQKT